MRVGLVGVVVAMLISSVPLAAQQPVRRELNVTPWGEVLRIGPNGGWRVKARQVAANRQRMLSRGAINQLNAPMAAGAAVAGSPAAVSGTFNVPVILFRFADHGAGAAFDTSQFNNVLFGDVPAGGRPYTVRTYYKEVSHNLLTLSGSAYGWFTLAGAESTYTGPAGGCPQSLNTVSHNCNGIFSQAAFSSMRTAFTQALSQADASIDWTQYDNDGPDGVPNSGDDDGVVDLVIFAQSEEDGACFENTNNHPWSHESNGLGFSTHSVGHNGQHLIVNTYTMQSAVGGASACDTTKLMGVGTAAHETGHALDLPDLYDVGGPTEGAGEWAIMGSGNYTRPLSPAHHDAWSKQQLGWVTLTVLSTSGTYSFGPVERQGGDSVFLIRPAGSNPRGEYFLVENKQAVGSDTANMLTGEGGGGTAGKLGGLLIWHIDSAKVTQDGFNGTGNRNHVNSGSPNGVALMQADGLNQLTVSSGGNRGDRGDPYPGSSNNTVFGFSSNPKAVKNNDGSYVGFTIDSIKQVVPNGAMSFRITFGGVAIVQATSFAALVSVDGVKYNRFAQLLTAGTTHTIAIDSAQAPDGLTQYLFGAWSDGGARSHTFTAHQAGDSISATVTSKYLLKVTPTGAGTLSSPSFGAPALASGQFVPKDSVVMLIATPPTHGVVDTWAGDTVAQGDTLRLAMAHPFNVTVNFLAPTLDAHIVTQQIVGLSTGLSTTDKRYLDVLGNKNGQFDLGDFLAWVKETGAAPVSRVAAPLPPPATRVVTVQRRGKQ